MLHLGKFSVGTQVNELVRMTLMTLYEIFKMLEMREEECQEKAKVFDEFRRRKTSNELLNTP